MLLEVHDRDSDSLEASVGKMQDLVVTLKGNLNKTLEEAHQSLDQARTMDLSTEERSETFDNLKEEIDLVQNWANSALFVSKCIDRFPAEYLEKFQFVRYMFKTSLDDLKNSAQLAEQFLARRRKEAVDGLQETAYEQLRGDLVHFIISHFKPTLAFRPGWFSHGIRSTPHNCITRHHLSLSNLGP